MSDFESNAGNPDDARQKQPVGAETVLRTSDYEVMAHLDKVREHLTAIGNGELHTIGWNVPKDFDSDARYDVWNSLYDKVYPKHQATRKHTIAYGEVHNPSVAKHGVEPMEGIILFGAITTPGHDPQQVIVVRHDHDGIADSISIVAVSVEEAQKTMDSFGMAVTKR